MKTKKVLRIAVILLLAIVLVIAGFIGYIAWFKPDIPLRDIKVASTPERLERGKYLVNHVAGCIDCHSTRDWSKLSGPIIPGTEGKGGEVFDTALGFPGRFVAPNITPFHLKNWTDAEIYRALTAGVSKDGRPLFPLMPYLSYGTMATEDIYSVIAYIRTLPEINNTPEASQPDFPFSIILHTIPHEGVPGQIPPKGVTVDYGKYLVNMSGCIECHTIDKKGQIIEEKAFSGGRSFPLPGGTLHSANITPDQATGIGKWTQETFVGRFKASTYEKFSQVTVDKNGYNTIMPWTLYSGMDTTDLQAIYTYLRSVKPISNQVTQFVPRAQ
jgi:mono/diheme cytochrome c family protein